MLGLSLLHELQDECSRYLKAWIDYFDVSGSIKLIEVIRQIASYNRVFHSLYKIGRNGNIVFKGINNSKKKVTSSGARPEATDYY